MNDTKRETAAHFSRQAEAYAASPSHARGADLDIVAEFAAPGPDDICLDIACGPGHTALRMAETARRVIATDLAPGMIETARRMAAERGLANVLVQFAEAAALPFADASFDLVTCRIAPHHFPDVPGFVAEAARVLKAGGRFVLEDSLAPDDPETAAFLEDLEKRRDRTHVHSLSEREWRAAIAGAGLRIVRETVYAKVHDFGSWIRRTGLSEPEIAAIEAHVLAAPPAVRDALFDIAGGAVRHLRDRKLILRAERYGAPSTRSAAAATDLR